MLKAILFDLDDTLIDWSGFNSDWEQRERHHLRNVFDYICREVHPLKEFEDFLPKFLTRTRDAWEAGRSSLRAPHIGAVMVETLAALGVPREDIDEQRCLEAYDWGPPPGTKVFPDVFDALHLFQDKRVKIGIVTNAYQPMWMRDAEIEQHGLMPFFPECRISAADVGYLKPHPAIFEQALGCLDTTSDETIFVGDNPVADIAGAQGAGLQAVLRVSHPAPPMLSGLIVPDYAINSLKELPAILDEWHPGWR